MRLKSLEIAGGAHKLRGCEIGLSTIKGALSSLKLGVGAWSNYSLLLIRTKLRLDNAHRPHAALSVINNKVELKGTRRARFVFCQAVWPRTQPEGPLKVCALARSTRSRQQPGHYHNNNAALGPPINIYMLYASLLPAFVLRPPP